MNANIINRAFAKRTAITVVTLITLSACSLPGSYVTGRRDATTVDPSRPAPALEQEQELLYERHKKSDSAPQRSAVRDGASGAEETPPQTDDQDQRANFNTETYDHISENPFLTVTQNPLSTFSIDVDTASYSITRRHLHGGTLPPPGAVRIEELINYFNYDYAEPSDGRPFAVHTEVSIAPWRPEHKLLHIGLQTRRPIGNAAVTDSDRPANTNDPATNLPPRNLVFLLDVSGSMNEPNKLPLLVRAMKMLTEGMTARDRVAIVVYAGASGVVLPPTAGNDGPRINEALDRLEAGGSTNGGDGIRLAYDLARKNFNSQGINRVVLATDGDFNVGTTNQSELIRMIEKERESGVFLTVLGFGDGNYKDSTMEKLAHHGNGNYAYIDTIAEARKVLVAEGGATLVTIARDVKLQLEFNPAQVAGYRLIGYENRMLRSEDFNDDQKDAGEIGAGHSVTALYEIIPAGQPVPGASVDALKYQTVPATTTGAAHSDELLTVKIRYKTPEGGASMLASYPVVDAGLALERTSNNFRFSAAVASYGMLLRDSRYIGKGNFELTRDLARGALGADAHGYRAEFVRLVEMARDLK